jgi:hypothetical protein
VKIELRDQTGQPVPQFVVRADSVEERMILKAFFSHIANRAEFCFHGYCLTDGEVSSFNFGCKDRSDVSKE